MHIVNRLSGFFGDEDGEFVEASIPDIFNDIEGLVGQLEPEPQQRTNTNRDGMETEQEFETGIRSDTFPDKGFGGADDYLADINTERDMDQ